MFKHCKSNSGFTLVEMLVVVAILGIVLTFMVLGFKNFSAYQQFNQASSDVLFLLNQSHSRARSAEDDTSHGIKITSNGIIQFSGDTYDVLDPDNVITLYQLVTLTPFLTGGTDEIVFDKLTGLPSATGNILIEGVNYDTSTIVEITDTGIVQ